MTVRQRILAIRLNEKAIKNPDYANYIGVTTDIKVLPPNITNRKIQEQKKRCS